MSDTPKAVIFLAYANDDKDSLDTLTDEINGIRKKLLPQEGNIDVFYPVKDTSIDDIFGAFNEFKNRIAIFHFAGHANPTSIKASGQSLDSKKLAKLFAEHEPLVLVFLNGCSSEEQVEDYLKAGAKGVIATSGPVKDKIATEFALHFYECLALDDHIDKAFNTAMAKLEAKKHKAATKNQGIHRHIGPIRENNTSDKVRWGLFLKEEGAVLDWKVSTVAEESKLDNFKQSLKEKLKEGLRTLDSLIKSIESSNYKFDQEKLKKINDDLSMNIFNEEDIKALIESVQISQVESEQQLFLQSLKKIAIEIISEFFDQNDPRGKRRPDISFLINIDERKELKDLLTEFNFENLKQQKIIRELYQTIETIFENEFELDQYEVLNFELYFFRKLKIKLVHSISSNDGFSTEIKSYFRNTDTAKEEKVLKAKEDQRVELMQKYDDSINAEKTKIPLSKVYVEPEFKIYESCLNFGDPRRGHTSDNGFVSSGYQGNIHQYFHEVFQGRNPAKLPDDTKPRMIIVQGYPGQGKTSFSKRLINDLITQPSPSKKDIYYFKMKYLRNRQLLLDDTLGCLLKRAQLVLKSDELIKDDIDNSILIMDGFNELTQGSDNVKELNLVLEHLIDFCDIHRGLQIVITCRSGYLNFSFLDDAPFLQVLQIERFGEKQQTKWLKKYQKISRNDNLSLTTSIIEKYNQTDENGKFKYKKLSELLQMPIFLHYLINANINFNNPSKINTVYVFEQLFKKLIADFKKRNKVKSNPKTILNLLRNIAFVIFESSANYTYKSQLLEKGALSRKQIKLLRLLTENFYLKKISQNYVDTDLDVDEEDQDDFLFTFLHSSFLEFLVAEKIWLSLIKISEFEQEQKIYKKIINIFTTLFAAQRPNSEIIDHLIGIIKDKRSKDKVKLLTVRLNKFFEYFIEDATKKSLEEVDESTMNVFYGWFLVISYLNVKGGFFGNFSEKTKNMIVKFFQVDYFPKIRLKGVNFDGLDLSYTNLYQMDLQRSSFKNTVLYRCNFNRSNLNGACFKNAKLLKADLSLSKITEVDFTGASLEEADLSGAKTLGGTNFLDTNLSKTRFNGIEGIETFIHLESSIIDQTDFREVSGMKEYQLTFLRQTNALFDEEVD